MMVLNVRTWSLMLATIVLVPLTAAAQITDSFEHPPGISRAGQSVVVTSDGGYRTTRGRVVHVSETPLALAPKRAGLILTALPESQPRFAWKASKTTQLAAPSSPQATTGLNCPRSRRIWIGALLGAGAAAPLAKIVHRRWENEGGNGAAAAATTVAIGAAAGAFIGSWCVW
jgi:hypothetical protein